MGLNEKSAESAQGGSDRALKRHHRPIECFVVHDQTSLLSVHAVDCLEHTVGNAPATLMVFLIASILTLSFSKILFCSTQKVVCSGIIILKYRLTLVS